MHLRKPRQQTPGLWSGHSCLPSNSLVLRPFPDTCDRGRGRKVLGSSHSSSDRHFSRVLEVSEERHPCPAVRPLLAGSRDVVPIASSTERIILRIVANPGQKVDAKRCPHAHGLAMPAGRHGFVVIRQASWVARCCDGVSSDTRSSAHEKLWKPSKTQSGQHLPTPPSCSGAMTPAIVQESRQCRNTDIIFPHSRASRTIS
jgi:hypothetical protein